MSGRMTLTQEQVDYLHTNAYDLFNGDGADDIRWKYTGRGMVGYAGEASRHCFGWVGDDYALVTFELAKLQYCAALNERGETLAEVDGDTAAYEIGTRMYELGGPSRDSMGYSTIYYWRDVVVGDDVVLPETDSDY